MAIVLCPLAASASQVHIDAIRVYKSPEKTRIVFDHDGPVKYTEGILREPSRVYVDILSARLSPEARKKEKLDALSVGPIGGVRSAKRNNGKDVRVVFDLNSEVQKNIFSLLPVQGIGDRLVIDLYLQDKPNIEVPVKSQLSLTQKTDVIIAIDAGHGGDDPGAIGPGKLYEKDVVLEIAKKLYVLFEKEPGFRAKLIRKGDYYVALRKRTEIARSSRADVFLSIHADAFKAPKVNGASVYTVSLKGGATSETARLLAEKENRADLMGGVGVSVYLDDYSDETGEYLLEKIQENSLTFSLEMGDSVLSSLKKVTKLHKKTVEQAGFAVLKAPDMYSLLIEAGFISNPGESRKLATSGHQAKLANAIFQGVKSAVKARPPEGSYLLCLKRNECDEAKIHVVKQGDTLSEIAARYRVNLKKLKDLNGLRNDTIGAGRELKIPPR